MTDLSTSYLGLKLANPIVPSASPLSRNVVNLKRLEDSGASAVVLYSLFEEQLNYDSQLLGKILDQGTQTFAESLSYLPDMQDYNVGPNQYLELIKKAKKEIKIPIIASLNGSSIGNWVDYAEKIAEAGADALELNIYHIAANPAVASPAVEKQYLDIVAAVKNKIRIPVSVKLSPFFTSLPNFLHELSAKDVDGVVLFNRFYQADIDLEEMEVIHKVNYSSSADLLLPLRWTAIIHGQTPLDVAISSGVHTHEDVLKSVLAGANVAMMASELLVNGVSRITTILHDLEKWMVEHEYDSIEQMRGSMSIRSVKDPEKYERAQYLRVLDSYKPPYSSSFAG